MAKYRDIQVHTATIPPGTVTVNAAIVVPDLFAAHPEINRRGEKVTAKRNVITITHVPTGFAVVHSVVSIARAEEIAIKLAEAYGETWRDLRDVEMSRDRREILLTQVEFATSKRATKDACDKKIAKIVGRVIMRSAKE